MCARDQRNCHIDKDQCWKNLPQGNQIILKATHDTPRAVGKILRVQVPCIQIYYVFDWWNILQNEEVE